METQPQLTVLFVSTGRITPTEMIYPPQIAERIRALKEANLNVLLVLVHSFHPVKLFKTYLEIRAKARDVNLVHAQYGSMTALLAMLGSRNKPLIVSFAGSDLLGVGAKGIWWWLRNNLTFLAGCVAAQKSKLITAESQNLIKSLPHTFLAKAMRLSNGVNTRIFKPKDKNLIRKQLGWSEFNKYILFVPSKRNNVIVKNVSLALKIGNLLKQQDEQTKLEFIIDKKPIEVSDMMNAADCLLLCSLHEGSPNIIKEAMACNLPIVTVNVGDVKARLNRVWPSFVVSTYEPEYLTNKIIEVIKLNQRSNGAAELTSQGLTQDSITESLIEMYMTVVTIPASARQRISEWYDFDVTRLYKKATTAITATLKGI